MTKYIWVIYREELTYEDYFQESIWEVEDFGEEDSYEKAEKVGKEMLNKLWEPFKNLQLDIQTI